MGSDQPGEATVLVVDDEAELAELYTAFLSAQYEVRTATSGTEALEVVDESVDVALLDRRMPDMSGDEVLAAFRERSLTLQVAMLTAVEPTEDIVELPFDDYKTKPVDRADLLGLVETLLQRATYDDRSQELFRLVSKKTALELAGNDQSAEYEALVERIQTVREELDATLDALDTEAVIADLSDRNH